ncbi:hypothetical protein [Sporosarcina sp. A2]|uniref:hypothetical protein n=1 Tax=Sporosarcina sp. A2 TaxID=3393449 RepID=UPI003D7B80BE
MEPIQWTLTETFQFPAEYGKAVSAQDVKVTAGYTEQLTEDAVRLSGIYHVAANIGFDGEGLEAAASSDAVVIDDVDVQNNLGYFEYAVPLLVDLPSSDGGQLEATVTDATASATDDGTLTVMWTVVATETKAEVAVHEEAVAHVEAKIESTSSEMVEMGIDYVSDNEMLAFLNDLEDDVTVTSFRLNDVLVE